MSANLNEAPPIAAGVASVQVNVVDYNRFQGTSVVVDGNVFVHNTFEGCNIELQAITPMYWRGNICHNSRLIRPSQPPIKLGENCTPVPHFGIQR
jgi:hypothetical protein